MDTADTFAIVLVLTLVLVLFGAAMVMAAQKSFGSMESDIDRKVYKIFLYTFSLLFLADAVLIWIAALQSPVGLSITNLI